MLGKWTRTNCSSPAVAMSTSITINRPEVRNALTFRTYDLLEQAVRTTTARCLVITGADPAFCSGDDVRPSWAAASGPTGPSWWHPGSTPAADALLHTNVPDRGGGERRRRRLGHGAGDDGRHPGGIREGEVRRAVRAAGPVHRRGRHRPAGPARRPRAGGRAGVHRRGHRRRRPPRRSAWSAGWCPTRSCSTRRWAWPTGSPPTRRSPSRDQGRAAAPSTRTGASSANGSSRLCRSCSAPTTTARA